MDLNGKTVLVSGGSRGIGEAIAIRAAKDGANVVLLAKTDQPHPKLPGTIHTAAQAVADAGGTPLALVGDIRDDTFVASAIAETVERFGGLDVVVNNASAIDLSDSAVVGMKRFDLMHSINARGTFSVSTQAIEHLLLSDNPHILTISPPVSLEPEIFVGHTAYTMSKFGMSLVTMGLAGELRDKGVAVNSLWPRTAIWTAAVRNLFLGAGGPADVETRSRKPQIMADAAHVILTTPSNEATGQFFIDDEVLRARGQDLSRYSNGAADKDMALSMWSSPADATEAIGQGGDCCMDR